MALHLQGIFLLKIVSYTKHKCNYFIIKPFGQMLPVLKGVLRILFSYTKNCKIVINVYQMCEYLDGIFFWCLVKGVIELSFYLYR